jgi:hypothetical protein
MKYKNIEKFLLGFMNSLDAKGEKRMCSLHDSREHVNTAASRVKPFTSGYHVGLNASRTVSSRFHVLYLVFSLLSLQCKLLRLLFCPLVGSSMEVF